MDKDEINYILKDSVEIYIEYLNKSRSESAFDRKKIMKYNKLRLFKKKPVVNLINILDHINLIRNPETPLHQSKVFGRTFKINIENCGNSKKRQKAIIDCNCENIQNKSTQHRNIKEKIQIQQDLVKITESQQESIKKTGSEKASTEKIDDNVIKKICNATSALTEISSTEKNVHRFSDTNLADNCQDNVDFDDPKNSDNSIERVTNSKILNVSPPTTPVNDLFGNIISIQTHSQKLTKGVKLNIKLPTSLQYMSSQMPLSIDLDLTKFNFTQCIEEHNEVDVSKIKSNKTSKTRSTSLKRKNVSIIKQNKKTKINVTLENNRSCRNGLKQFYENFNDTVEENVTESNNIIPSTSNQLESIDENACQNPRIDTTSSFEFPDKMLPIGSIITNENGNIVVSLPQDQEIDSNEAVSQSADIQPNQLSSTVNNPNIFEQQYAIEFRNGEQVTTTISLISKTKTSELITKEPSINKNCSEENVISIERGKSKRPNNELAKKGYPDMPLLDDTLNVSSPTISPEKSKEVDNSGEESVKGQNNLTLTHKPKTVPEQFLNNSNIDGLKSSTNKKEIASIPKNQDALVLEESSRYKEKDKPTENKTNMLEFSTSNKEQEILNINPHKVIDDFLNSDNQLDFEPEDDAISLCCSPNIFDDIEIPNMKLLDADASKSSKILPKEKDDFFLEDYSNFDIFGIPRARNKTENGNENHVNLNKTFKIPKIPRATLNSENSQITRCSSITQPDYDSRPIRPCWPNNPTNIARPPPNYISHLVPEITDDSNKMFKNVSPQIAQVFDKPCLDNLKNSCEKRTNCRFRHTFLDKKEVKDRVLLFGDQHVVSSYNFIKQHEKLFHYYFTMFCEIFTEKKQLNMLNQMIKDSILYTEQLNSLKILTKFLIKFGKMKHEALQIILKAIEGIPNLDGVIVDLVCDDDVILYYLNILSNYQKNSYKFNSATVNKLAAIYLKHPNEQLCKIILDIVWNDTEDLRNKIAEEKNESLKAFLEICRNMYTPQNRV